MIGCFPEPKFEDADFAVPSWASVKGSDVDEVGTAGFLRDPFDVGMDEDALPADIAPLSVPVIPPAPTAGATPPKPTVRATKSWGAKAKSAPTASSGKQSGRGGRWQLKAFRGLAFTLMVILILLGLKGILLTKKATPVEVLTAQVAAAINGNGFPLVAGQAFADQFAKQYLTYSPASKAARADALKRYSPDSASGSWGWDGQGSQAVLNGPFAGDSPEQQDPTHAIFTVAAQVTGGNWIYLAVPVFTNGDYGFIVSAPPAFVTSPYLATAPQGAEVTGQADGDLAALLKRDLFDGPTGFFAAWAATDDVSLKRLTTPDAQITVRNGLGGVVTLGKIQNVSTLKAPGPERIAVVSVVWTTPNAGSYTQSYKVTVRPDENGKYQVSDLRAGDKP